MNHFIKTYRAVLSISLTRYLTYRIDAITNTFLSAGVWSVFNIISMYLVSSRSTTIFGWTPGELILISCLYNIFIGIFAFFFMRGISEFPDIVDRGLLDSLLLKPLDSQFYVSAHSAQYQSLIRVLIGIVLGTVVCNVYGIPISPINSVLFLLSLVPALILLYACLFMINTLIIWSPRTDNITHLFYTLRSLGRYPRETFSNAHELVFVFVAPFVIVLSTPARILLGKATLYDALELCIAAAIFFVASRMFWKFALRHYTSASG